MYGTDPDDAEERRDFSRRMMLLGLGQAGLFTALGTRLFHLQVSEHGRYSLLADENRISVEALSPARGRIFDRFGEVLATNSDGYRVTVVPSLAGDLDLILRRLSRFIPITDVERERFMHALERRLRGHTLARLEAEVCSALRGRAIRAD
mgnify:CR=1 FL=1